MNKNILINNVSSIVTCNANDAVYYDSNILIEGSKIIRIGKAIRETAEEVIDASGCLGWTVSKLVRQKRA